jgi:hypothetical protein
MDSCHNVSEFEDADKFNCFSMRRITTRFFVPGRYPHGLAQDLNDLLDGLFPEPLNELLTIFQRRVFKILHAYLTP